MKKTVPLSTVKNVLRFLKGSRAKIVLSLLCAAVKTMLTLAVPLLFGYALDAIAGAGKVDFADVKSKLLYISASVAVCAAVSWIMQTLNNKITYSAVRDIRNRAFEQINLLPFSYLDKRPQGETLSRIVNDTEIFSDGLLQGFSQFFTGVLTIIATLVLLLKISIPVGLVVALLTPLSLVVSGYIAGHTGKYFHERASLQAEETGFVNESLTGLNTVKSNGAEEIFSSRFGGLDRKYNAVALKAVFFSSLTNPCTRFVNSLVYAGVALTGALGVTGAIPFAGLTVGMFATALGYANQYTKPFNEMASVFAELQNALCCAERMLEITAEPVPEEPSGNINSSEVTGDVCAENVNFSYDGIRNVINDFSFEAKPGQKIAIVGPTGCGKTTAVNLLMKFYDAGSGNIRIDGHDYSSLPGSGVRSCYSMVLQDTFLKNTSIKENIRFSKPDATDEEIVDAAKRAHAHSFIKRLGSGYDTVTGENGGNLSEGQKQLICIARAMLCDSPVLILDEATSSIDLRTEIKVQKAFCELMKGRTSIVIAHRLSTIADADLILVMKDGRIIEAGTHRGLLEQNGFYAGMWGSNI